MNLLSILAATSTATNEFVGASGALLLMAIGMITVFIVLLLVIFVGKGLIAFVNRFIPEDEPAEKAAFVTAPASVDAVTADVIARAVNTLTGGKGKVESIKKI